MDSAYLGKMYVHHNRIKKRNHLDDNDGDIWSQYYRKGAGFDSGSASNVLKYITRRDAKRIINSKSI